MFQSVVITNDKINVFYSFFDLYKYKFITINSTLSLTHLNRNVYKINLMDSTINTVNNLILYNDIDILYYDNIYTTSTDTLEFYVNNNIKTNIISLVYNKINNILHKYNIENVVTHTNEKISHK